MVGKQRALRAANMFMNFNTLLTRDVRSIITRMIIESRNDKEWRPMEIERKRTLHSTYEMDVKKGYTLTLEELIGS